MSIPTAPMYSASKHAVLGFARSVAIAVKKRGIRVNVIHPFFSGRSLCIAPRRNAEPEECTATGILDVSNQVFLAGIPMVPVNRIAATTVYAATHPDIETTGSVFTLIDDGSVLHLENEIIKGGVYDIVSARAARVTKWVHFLDILDVGSHLSSSAVTYIGVGIGVAKALMPRILRVATLMGLAAFVYTYILRR